MRSYLRGTLLSLGALLLLGLAARAQEHQRSAAPSAGASVPLYANLGTLHRSVASKSPRARKYFDQGLRLAYAFNAAEAIASFTEATRLDPGCAMCYWGIAYALGPNVNVPMEASSAEPAYRLSTGETPRNRALMQATAKRYAPDPAPSPSDRAPLDSAYATALQQVAAQYPADPDVAALYAESIMLLSPWNYWTRDLEPRPGTAELVSLLARTVKTYPDHPGVCHLYIHAVEASTDPGRALPCAERLAELMPGAGHLVHMPAHIYIRVGMYAKAAEHNEHAVAVDEKYIQDRSPSGVYPMMYYPHNIHFLWAATSMEGKSAEAIESARKVAAKVPPEVVSQLPPLEFVVPTPYYALARFGHWDEILNEPPPAPELRFTAGMWRYARGLAYAAKGRVDEAEAEQESVATAAGATPEEATVGINSAQALLRIADRHLAAMIAVKRGKIDEGIAALRQAIELEDGLRYDEPPAWYLPIRQVLGGVLLQADRPQEAEVAYREDLRRNPENGWSLYGLAQCLRSQGRNGEAATVDADFKRAWAASDVGSPLGMN